MYKPTTIGLAGEKAIITWLRQNGWQIIRWDTAAPGSTDIEAKVALKKLLVQVKSAIAPATPSFLSLAEAKNIKSRATRLGAEAWEARVVLYNNLNPAGIGWRQFR